MSLSMYRYGQPLLVIFLVAFIHCICLHFKDEDFDIEEGATISTIKTKVSNNNYTEEITPDMTTSSTQNNEKAIFSNMGKAGRGTIEHQLNKQHEDYDIEESATNSTRKTKFSNNDTEENTPEMTTNSSTQNNEPMIFLHMGKGGGGTLEDQLKKQHVPFRLCHPKPCLNRFYDELLHGRRVIINIRDPVDRFVSAFYWSSLIYCNPQNNDTRIKDNKGRYLGRPDKYCLLASRFVGVEEEVAMIRENYQKNVSLLAEALCSKDTNVSQRALHDAGLIEHVRYSIADWLGNLTSSSSSSRIAAVVLEPGFDFQEQGNEAIHWAMGGAGRRKRRSLSSSQHRHSSRGWTQDPQPPLSELGACCLARYYRKDYELIQELKTKGCHGENSQICQNALGSISSRRTPLLDDNVSCQTLVTLQKT